ncbi:hypothetical protein QL285_061719 [Trifolium repens]|nr:hypothetical protein QL285_061719 [Trifolium repens]
MVGIRGFMGKYSAKSEERFNIQKQNPITTTYDPRLIWERRTSRRSAHRPPPCRRPVFSIRVLLLASWEGKKSWGFQIHDLGKKEGFRALVKVKRD